MELLKLLEKAETNSSPPEEPSGGIPKQRLPSWLRWTLRALILPFIHLEVATERIARWIVPPPFIKTGKCKRRGNCCHYILLPETKGILGKILFFWYTEVYGFFPRRNEPYEYEGKKVLAMGCRYLQKNGRCGKHFFRPKLCRTWPLIEIFHIPRVLKGCGYQAKLKDSYAKKYPQLAVLPEDEIP